MKYMKAMNLSYTYDAARKGAKYTINGGKSWLNGGEFAEAAAKAAHGLDAAKDANTRFNEGSDVPEFHASVKSSKASLTNMKLADSFEASLTAYFEQVASSEFWYVTIADELVTIYKMNATKFEKFLRKFSKLNERGVIRIAATSSKMLAWLDANA
jgi:hypothetical protein